MSPLTITLIILVLTIIAFMSGKVPFSLISTCIILALIQTGVLSPSEAFSGFTNTNVVMFCAMFVVGAAITKTTMLDRAQVLVTSYKNKPKILILMASIVASILAIVTSATATAAIMLPLLIGIANEIGTSRSKLLFPAIVAANIATGMTFLGQGASNMTWSDVMLKAGGTTPFNIWSFTLARIPILIICLIYVAVIAGRLLPDIDNELFDDNIKKKETGAKLSPIKEKAAIAIIAATILAMIFADVIGIKMYILACIGACLLVIFGVLNEKEALGSIHLPTVFLFAGVLPLSDAIKITGAGDVVAEKMIMLLGNTTNPYIIMAVFFLVPLILTQVMSNIATITIFVPLVSAASVKIGVDPRAAVMGVLIAGCASILTPMACPAQTIIMGPGGYKMKDYLKCGLPLVLIITAFSIVWLPFIFPFY